MMAVNQEILHGTRPGGEVRTFKLGTTSQIGTAEIEVIHSSDVVTHEYDNVHGPFLSVQQLLSDERWGHR